MTLESLAETLYREFPHDQDAVQIALLRILQHEVPPILELDRYARRAVRVTRWELYQLAKRRAETQIQDTEVDIESQGMGNVLGLAESSIASTVVDPEQERLVIALEQLKQLPVQVVLDALTRGPLTRAAKSRRVRGLAHYRRGESSNDRMPR